MTEAQEEDKCVITGLPAVTGWREQFVSRGYRTDAISYQVREETATDIKDHPSQLDEADKIKLAYHILKANRNGVEYPNLDDICPDIAENPKQAVQALQDPTVDERIASYLQWVRDETGGDLSKAIDSSDNFAGVIASCPKNRDEQGGFIQELADRGYVKAIGTSSFGGPASSMEIRLTLYGLHYCEELQKEISVSKEIFVAMWFDGQMNGFYAHIKQELEAAEYGFEVIRIDKEEHNNKIDDEIIARLRSCRLVIADFTCANGGKAHRGGVYYEAGFAHGLNKNVIFTAREDCKDALHFDTRQYNHILWKKDGENFVVAKEPEKTLAQAILDRIQAINA